jgi:hypothetical protein
VNKLANRPTVIGYAKRHRESATQRFMDSAEVVERDPQGDRSAVSFYLFAIPVR